MLEAHRRWWFRLSDQLIIPSPASRPRQNNNQRGRTTYGRQKHTLRLHLRITMTDSRSVGWASLQEPHTNRGMDVDTSAAFRLVPRRV